MAMVYLQAAWASIMALKKIGTKIIPASGGMTQRQIKLMKDLDATILACTPSFAVYLAETMAQEGVDPRKDLKLKIGMFGAEPWSDKIRERIEKDLGIEAFDVYGLTELCGPGVSIECPEHNGLHIAEDHFIVETIDPDTGEVLPAWRRRRISLYNTEQNRLTHAQIQNKRHIQSTNRKMQMRTHTRQNDAGPRKIR